MQNREHKGGWYKITLIKYRSNYGNGGSAAEDKLYKVIIGDFMEINELLPDHYFDLIICNDIIEHIDDYNLFFKILKKKMNVDSHIIGSIPNVRFYDNLIRLDDYFGVDAK